MTIGFTLDKIFYETDKYGYLKDINQWNKHIAEYLARVEGIEDLTSDQWVIIKYLRNYYKERQVSPLSLVLIKSIMVSKNISRRESVLLLYESFPHGPSKQGCKIAGLPRPKGCSRDY